jgi:hypothetical protein
LPKGKSDYKAALEKLREKHGGKLESIFNEMYAITQNAGAEDKDKVNAAKTCVSMLGVPRPAPERQDPAGPSKIEKPTLSKEHSAVLDGILGPRT